MKFQDVYRSLSDAQIKYMAHNPNAVITSWDEDGWVIVEDRDSIGEEGSGVWLDRNGVEQYG